VTNIATLNSCILTNGLFVQAGRNREITVTVSAGSPTTLWANAIGNNELIKSCHTFNKTAITGAAGFTGYSVGYTATAGNNVTAWGTNLSPAINQVNGTYDYALTSPIYTEDNANRDVLLTAVGGNFATGQIKLCIIYERFTSITS
jgi:hypothetical protein